MAKRVTTDHGEIIHFAGRKHLFPVANAGEARLATREELKEGDVRVSWAEYFRPFIDRHLVFLYDDAGGQAATREEAAAAVAQDSAGPAGAASAQ